MKRAGPLHPVSLKVKGEGEGSPRQGCLMTPFRVAVLSEDRLCTLASGDSFMQHPGARGLRFAKVCSGLPVDPV